MKRKEKQKTENSTNLNIARHAQLDIYKKKLVMFWAWRHHGNNIVPGNTAVMPQCYHYQDVTFKWIFTLCFSVA